MTKVSNEFVTYWKTIYYICNKNYELL